MPGAGGGGTGQAALASGAASAGTLPPMRRPNHASRFEGIAKTKLQASRVSDTETLQSQVNKAAKKRLSLSGLEILHGRLYRGGQDSTRTPGRRLGGKDQGECGFPDALELRLWRLGLCRCP